jgi:hypothetical protein
MIPPREFANQIALKGPRNGNQEWKRRGIFGGIAFILHQQRNPAKPGHGIRAERWVQAHDGGFPMFAQAAIVAKYSDRYVELPSSPHNVSKGRVLQEPLRSASQHSFPKVLQRTCAHERVKALAVLPPRQASKLMWCKYGPFALLRIQGRSASTHRLHPIQLPRGVQGTACKAQELPLEVLWVLSVGAQ